MEENANLGKVGKTQQTDTTLLYLDMVKRSLTDSIYWDDPLAIYTFLSPRRQQGNMEAIRRSRSYRSFWIVVIRYASLDLILSPGWETTANSSKDELANRRLMGNYWPVRAHTMVGLKRLDNIQFCVETAIKDGIPGDLIETGVWRGGSCIFMRAILAAYVDTTRICVGSGFVRWTSSPQCCGLSR